MTGGGGDEDVVTGCGDDNGSVNDALRLDVCFCLQRCYL